LHKEVSHITFKASLHKKKKGGVESLVQQWAKNYLQNLQANEDDKPLTT
jgi:hypothetical protein